MKKVLRYPMVSLFKQNKAFTLAEVVIVAGIIGLIAELTLPSLISNVQEAVLKTAWKKNYSILSNVTNQIKQENGGYMSNIFSNGNGMLNEYAKYVSIIKTCSSNSVSEGCIASINYKGLDGTGNGGADGLSIPGVILKDGTSVLFKTYGANTELNCNQTWPGGSYPFTEYCGNLYIDVNGLKTPNTVGKDLFIISITKSGAYASGSPGAPLGISDWTRSCNPANTTYAWRGQGCAAKYLLE